MQTKTKQKKWIYPRHRFARNLLAVVLGPVTMLKYGVQVQRFQQQEEKPCLILFNHQTAFDQFFVGLAFNRPVYYVASEDLFSNGWVSSVIRYLVAPIPIKKQTTDIGAVMNCIRVAREGGTIAIAPEGNRTYSGKTVYMNPAIGGLARKLKLPIALFRIEGGYGIQPRWSDITRRGKMKAYVSRVIEPEEYENMTADELFALIQSELQVDETAVDGLYKSGRRAEYLERAMYVCPKCGLSEFESRKNKVTCKKCGLTATYEENKTFTGEAFPFRFVNDWYEYQSKFINDLDVTACTEQPLYVDKADFSQVFVYKTKKRLLKNASVSLYGDRIVINEGCETAKIFTFADTDAVTVLGKNKVNIYFGKDLFQLKSGKRFNALKYVHIYNRYKNITRGNPNAEFLGL